MSDFEERESIVLNNRGEKIFGILHLPKRVENPPCVLFCHGLGGHKTGRYRVYVDLAESLTKSDIAVLRFDFRGSGDSEGNFSDMTLEGEVSDAYVALQSLRKNGLIDPNRIGVFGRSLGGAVAVTTAAIDSQIRSLALWAPIYSGNQWMSLWEKVQNGSATEEETIEMRRINGQVAGFPFYRELFELNIQEQLKKLTSIPLLLIHGLKDDMVYLEHSEFYSQERKNVKALTEFIRLPKGDHDFTFSSERVYAIQKTTQWFVETL